MARAIYCGVKLDYNAKWRQNCGKKIGIARKKEKREVCAGDISNIGRVQVLPPTAQT